MFDKDKRKPTQLYGLTDSEAFFELSAMLDVDSAFFSSIFLFNKASVCALISGNVGRVSPVFDVYLGYSSSVISSIITSSKSSATCSSEY